METDDLTKEPVSSEEQAPQIFSPSLMSVPEEVIQDCILPFLNYKELLPLRRVSKPIKILAEKVLRKRVQDVVREINGTDFTFERYLQLNLPTTSIYLNNKSSAIFQDPNVPAFIRLYGAKITHLKVQLFSSCVSEQELHFYSMLPNLKVLDIQRIEIPSSVEALPFPANFRNLKGLKLNDIQGPSKETCQNYVWHLIDICGNLEYLKGSRISIDQIVDYIRNRRRTHPELPNLRFYDMEHFQSMTEDVDDANHWAMHIERLTRLEVSFVGLLEICYEQGVKLLNVHSDHHNASRLLFELLEAPLEAFSTPIVSLRNIGQMATFVELPFLEKLTIKSTYWSCFRRELGIGEIARWPKLKQVDLTIDGLVRQQDNISGEEATIRLLNFLFGSERQLGRIQDMAIRYAEKYRQWRDDKQLRQFPWVKKLTTTCPLLTKLTLDNWKGEGLIGFWEGFPFLEEIVLQACEQIGDEDFVGGHKAFLNLRNLNKLSLKGLHLMRNITDLAFQTVFKHLKIRQFYLTSEQPLKSVTAAGIESLVAGQFNSSVEKFPFDGWSLDGVSPEAFAQLKIRFRASRML